MINYSQFNTTPDHAYNIARAMDPVLSLHSSDLHSDVLADLGSVDVALNSQVDQNTVGAASVHVCNGGVLSKAGEAADLHVLTDGHDQLLHLLGNGQVGAGVGAGLQSVHISGSVLSDDLAQVPQAEIDKELAVQVALMDNDPKMANKPAAVKEKIAAGKMAAFYKEICLLQQEFVRADLFKGDVAGYIADAAKKLGGKVTFVDAIHYTKGEGIEKKEENFAAEVAAQIAGAGK